MIISKENIYIILYIFALMENKRNNYLDFVKAVLIFFVTFGHFIQMFGFKFQSAFWDDRFSQLILSFHMPLFIGVSGFFTYKSQKYNLKQYAKNRFLRLFIPMLSWCVISFVIFSLISKTFNFNSFLYIFEFGYWFIWAILFFSILLWLLDKLQLDNIYIMIFSIIVLTLIPFNKFQYPLIKSMFPFFIFGCIVAKYNTKKFTYYAKKCTLIIIAIALICILFWDKTSNAYLTPTSIYSIKISIFRLIASTFISISVLLILDFIYSKISAFRVTKFICRLGRETLGLYLAQGAILYSYMSLLMKNDINDYNLIVCFLMTILFMISFYYIITLFNKNKLLGIALFGNK